MDSLTFEIDGLAELERDLEAVIKEAPREAKKTLRKLGRDFMKSAKKRADSELKHHERAGNEKNKSIKRKWGSKVIERGGELTALVWNSARHFHLVEYGHNLVRGNQIIGFVPGKHIMENTRNEYQDIARDCFEEMIDKVLKGRDLD